jgi:hypothetical protein
MDQRPPSCAHRAPRPPVPPTTTSIAQAPLYTVPWPYQPDGVYRPLLPGMAGMTIVDHGQTNSVGYSCSPYSVPPTLSQMGITSAGHVTRWWVPEGYDGMNPHHAYMPYFLYLYTRPTPCGSDSETQNDRICCHSRGRARCRLRE